MKALKIVVLSISILTASAQATLTKLFDFTDGGPDDDSGLVFDGSRFYGTNSSGGTFGDGIVYAINPDGSGFTVLHNFESSVDGESSDGTLTLHNGVLYGATEFGGSVGSGTLFAINTDGNNFSTLYNFDSSQTDEGYDPTGNLLIHDGKIYGVLSQNDSGNKSVAFSVDLDGSNYTKLSELGTLDESQSLSSLITDGTRLYGMTLAEFDNQTNNDGSIFSMNLDGSDYSLLHEFMGGAGDGSGPRGNLLLDNGMLYGMTDTGGTGNDGVIFSIDANGGNFNILHEFVQNVDGKDAEGSLIRVGDLLYGITEDGGLFDDGIIFSLGLDGSGFNMLASFEESTTGGDPEGTLFHHNGELFGVTNNGGVFDEGTIFKFTIPVTVAEPSVVTLLGISVLVMVRRRRQKPTLQNTSR